MNPFIFFDCDCFRCQSRDALQREESGRRTLPLPTSVTSWKSSKYSMFSFHELKIPRRRTLKLGVLLYLESHSFRAGPSTFALSQYWSSPLFPAHRPASDDQHPKVDSIDAAASTVQSSKGKPRPGGHSLCCSVVLRSLCPLTPSPSPS